MFLPMINDFCLIYGFQFNKVRFLKGQDKNFKYVNPDRYKNKDR